MSRFYLYIGISLLLLVVTMTFTSNYVIEERAIIINRLATEIEKQAYSSAVIYTDREVQNKLQLEYFSQLDLLEQALSSGHYRMLDDLFMQLMKVKSSIMQVRLLNLQGQELYRIDDSDGAITRVPDSQLQNKGNRYYVQELLTTPGAQTYTSNIDLNVEHGVIEEPYRPVLRVAKKIVNQANDQELGALMFNFDLNRLFTELNASIPEHMNWYFIDNNGQFLAHPDPQARYCAQLLCTRFHYGHNYNPSERNYYQQHLASVLNINSIAGLEGSDMQLILAYKPDYMAQYTMPKSNFMVLLSSVLWWTMLIVTLTILALCCLLYEHYQQKISDKINRAKMQAVLEGVTEMLERLHENDDPVTGSHVQRVAAYSRLLAEHLGLDKQLVEDIHRFSSLHDIGKISTPDSILGKPGKLDPDEWAIMQKHVEKGYDLLHQFELSEVAENIVRSHHERWDGNGYPRKIKGEDIPIEARIVSLVDCFDALMSERPYKKAFSFEKSKSIINELRGTAFDPKLVDLFNSLEREFKAMRSNI